jgi:hypothetical protein
MNTYVVEEAQILALLTTTVDERELIFYASAAVPPRKGPPRPT